jgi:DNA-binding NarL/FixJ family response regulator
VFGAVGRQLTPEQAMILRFIVQGMTNEQIAHELGITEAGVKAHVTRLLRKFSVANRAGLAAVAVAEGLAQPPRV